MSDLSKVTGVSTTDYSRLCKSAVQYVSMVQPRSTIRTVGVNLSIGEYTWSVFM